MRNALIARSAAAAALLLLAGCAGQATLEEGFGSSVRHMTAQQIHNLDAAYNPDPSPVTGADVGTLNNVLEIYRVTAGNPADVVAPLTGTVSR